MFFDTHCHLDLEPLCGQLAAVLQRARAAGLERFLVPGIKPEWWQRIKLLAAADKRILPAFGIHPQLAELASAAALELLAGYAKGATAIGEIGLDYTPGSPPREMQQEAFRTQLRLGVATGLPVIIHCRHAFADLLRIMKEEGVAKVGGFMHAFSGSLEVARECTGLGLKIGIAGPVTWSNAVKPITVVRGIPLEHLVLETDSPDLTPEPYRGGVNEPAFLVAIAQKVADIKGVRFETVASATTLNAERMLNVRSTPLFPN